MRSIKPEAGVKSLFGWLVEAGVVLAIDAAGRLLIDAPAGVMTELIVAEVRACRDELLALVECWGERAAIRENDGGLSRSDAERLALVDVLGGDDPEVVPVSSPGVLCPWCRRGDRLADDPGGLRCGRCRRLAWRDDPGGSLVRCDWTEPAKAPGGRFSRGGLIGDTLGPHAFDRAAKQIEG